MKQLPQLLLSIFSYFTRLIGQNKDTIIGLSALAFAAISTLYAVRGFSSSNDQFKLNSIHADSLFNVQLKAAKVQHDSLVGEIEDLQKITERQSQIIESLLSMTELTLENKKYSDRPILTFGRVKIVNEYDIDMKTYGPQIHVPYQNTGNRTATNLTNRPFILTKDFTVTNSPTGDRIVLNILSKENHITDYKPKFPYENREEFYFCIEYRYYDTVLKRNFIIPLYNQYYKNRGEFTFRTCDNKETSALNEAINQYLKSEGLPRFNKYPTEF